MNAKNLALQMGVQRSRFLTVFACCAEAGNDNAVGYRADVCTDLPLSQGESVAQLMLYSPELKCLPGGACCLTNYTSPLLLRGALHTGENEHIPLYP